MRTMIIGADEAGLSAELERHLPGAPQHSTRAALRLPGLLGDADQVVFCWPPGTNPTLEAHAFAAGIGALHLAVGPAAAQIGPYVLPGCSPCPHCLSSPGPHGHAPSRGVGLWAVAWLVVELEALDRHGATDLVGRAYRWDAASPGLQEIGWPGLGGCGRPGCVSCPG